MRYLIAHAPHAPGRKASLARLLAALPRRQFDANIDGGWSCQPDMVIASRGPEHAAIWARRIWEYAADNFPDEHVCILNDDVHVAPDLDARLARAVEALPDEPISLHATTPAVAAVDGAWARCYHYSGPGVILPPGGAAGLLDFVYSLPWSVLSRMNEDGIANAWAWSRQRPFWYLLPSPIAHDPAIPSTLGHDAHTHRVPVLGLDLPERDLSIPNRDAVPFVELEWCVTPGLRYRREVLRSGQVLCYLCVGRPGNVGSVEQGVMLCNVCLADLASVALRAK